MALNIQTLFLAGLVTVVAVCVLAFCGNRKNMLCSIGVSRLVIVGTVMLGAIIVQVSHIPMLTLPESGRGGQLTLTIASWILLAVVYLLFRLFAILAVHCGGPIYFLTLIAFLAPSGKVPSTQELVWFGFYAFIISSLLSALYAFFFFLRWRIGPTRINN